MIIARRIKWFCIRRPSTGNSVCGVSGAWNLITRKKNAIGEKNEGSIMSKKTAQQELQELAQRWANKLGINGYKVCIHVIDPDDMDEILSGDDITHDYAHVITSEDKQEADIYLNSKYLTDEPEETENTIVHELIHVLLNQLMEGTMDTINSYVSDQHSKEFLSRQLGKMEHRIVVNMARALTEGDK